jgi:hypothetical protein
VSGLKNPFYGGQRLRLLCRLMLSPGETGHQTNRRIRNEDRIDVTAVSWIPEGSVKGLAKQSFSLGLTHYDVEPPVVVDDIDALLCDDRLREANVLRAWIDVEAGKIVHYGQTGTGYLGSTTMKLGPAALTVKGHAKPTLRHLLQANERYVMFAQTVGGRTRFPFPRPVPHAPFFQCHSAIAWTTLALTLHADGRVERELIGASLFPRHYLYDAQGELIGDTMTTDFPTWFTSSFGRRTPWNGIDRKPEVHLVRPAVMPAVA